MHLDIGAQKIIPGDTRGIAPSYPSDLPDDVNPILDEEKAILHKRSSSRKGDKGDGSRRQGINGGTAVINDAVCPSTR